MKQTPVGNIVQLTRRHIANISKYKIIFPPFNRCLGIQSNLYSLHRAMKNPTDSPGCTSAVVYSQTTLRNSS